MKLNGVRAVVFFVGWLVFSPGAQAQDALRIHVGTTTRSVSWFPLYVAMKKGFFEEQGFSPVPVTMEARVAVTALATKEIPYIAVLGSAINGAARGLPIKLVMGLGAKSHRVLVAGPEIKSVADLRGRTVATSQPGSDPDADLAVILKRHGIDSKEVKTLPVGADMNRVIAVRSHRADAMITGIPYNLLVEKAGFRPLVYVKDVVDIPIMGLFTHNDRLRDNPQELKKIIAAILKGIGYTKSHRDEVLPLLKEFVKLDDLEMAGKAYDAVKDIWPADGLITTEGLRNVFARAGLSTAMPLEKIVNWSPLLETERALNKARY